MDSSEIVELQDHLEQQDAMNLSQDFSYDDSDSSGSSSDCEDDGENKNVNYLSYEMSDLSTNEKEVHASSEEESDDGKTFNKNKRVLSDSTKEEQKEGKRMKLFSPSNSDGIPDVPRGSQRNRNNPSKRNKKNGSFGKKKNNSTKKSLVSANNSIDEKEKLSRYDDEQLLSIIVFNDLINRYPGHAQLIQELMELIAGSQKKTQIANNLIRQVNSKGSGQLFLKEGYSATARELVTKVKFDYTAIVDTRLTRNIEAISHFLLYTIFQEPKFKDEAYYISEEGGDISFHSLITKEIAFKASHAIKSYEMSKKIWTKVEPVDDSYQLIQVGSHSVLTGITVLMRMGIHLNSLMVRNNSKEGKVRVTTYRPKLEQTGKDLDNHNPFRASHKVSRHGNIFPKDVFNGTKIEDFFKVFFSYMESEVELINKYPPHVVNVQPDLIIVDWAEALEKDLKGEAKSYVYQKFQEFSFAVTLPNLNLYRKIFEKNCKDNSDFRRTLQLYQTLPIFGQRKELFSNERSCLNALVSLYLAWCVEYKKLVQGKCQTKGQIQGIRESVKRNMNPKEMMKLNDTEFKKRISPLVNYRSMIDNLQRQINDGKSQTIVMGDITTPRTDMALRVVNQIRKDFQHASSNFIMGDKTYRFIKTNQEYKIFSTDPGDRVITTSTTDSMSVSPESIFSEEFVSDVLILTDDLENLDGNFSSNSVLNKFFRQHINIWEEASRKFNYALRQLSKDAGFQQKKTALHKSALSKCQEDLKACGEKVAYLVVRNDNENHGFRRTIVETLACHYDNTYSNGFHTVFRFQFEPTSLVERVCARKNILSYHASIYHFSNMRSERICQSLDFINGGKTGEKSYLTDLHSLFGTDYLIQTRKGKEDEVNIPTDYGDDFDLYDDGEDFDFF